jgi:predicted metal-dependent hydrolase
MSEMPVEIVRSARRKRTLQAQVVAGTIRVRVPAGLPAEEERTMVDELVARVRSKLEAGRIDLQARAQRLAEEFGLPRPSSVEWSERQNLRWGSCSVAQGRIRISSRLTGVPEFVLDYVILHELAHLTARGHGPDFKKLVSGYAQAERAEGYLMALNQIG